MRSVAALLYFHLQLLDF